MSGTLRASQYHVNMILDDFHFRFKYRLSNARLDEQRNRGMMMERRENVLTFGQANICISMHGPNREVQTRHGRTTNAERFSCHLMQQLVHSREKIVPTRQAEKFFAVIVAFPPTNCKKTLLIETRTY